MKTRLLFISLLIPVMVLCTPNNAENQNGDNGQNTNPVEVDPADELAPEIQDGDNILATNQLVETFITTVDYPERDYSYSAIKRGNNGIYKDQVSPGVSDIPSTYTIRFEGNKTDVYTGTLSEGDWSYTKNIGTTEDGYWEITNLRPNASYTYQVKNGGTVVKSGHFTTYGHLHQLTFKARVRNVRDLGGWKTKDGKKMIKYRKIYRGGRLQESTLTSAGIKDVLGEGIRAQLDLRGHTTSGSQEYLDHSAMDGYPNADSKYTFLAPCIEEGYTQMLRDDKEKTRQCIAFIFNCIANDEPVYYHCSLGRDRTGTISLLLLGILGVNEGDISKEYEITQFAPAGYSVSEGEKTQMTRLLGVDYDGAAMFLWNYGKHEDGSYDEFQTCVQKYFNEIGIDDSAIETFRAAMLEDVPAN
ncbi:MAG: tyrosine-protein phosphatase [Bacteroidales bacterium]|nr:tyrosine-protein phosphatase [Bacteroidales bacterium]